MPDTTRTDPIDALAEAIGDYCHTKYLGCYNENDTWHYSYKDEVVNMAHEFFTTDEGKKAVAALIRQAEERALAKFAQECLDADKIDDSACYVDRKRLKELAAHEHIEGNV